MCIILGMGELVTLADQQVFSVKVSLVFNAVKVDFSHSDGRGGITLDQKNAAISMLREAINVVELHKVGASQKSPIIVGPDHRG